MQTARKPKEWLLVKEVNPPAARTVRAAAVEYMNQAGMEQADLAREIGYKRQTLNFFLNNRYTELAKRDDIIRARLWDYMQRHPLAGLDGDIPDKLLHTADTQLILERIEQAHQRQRVIVLEGPPGTSKTTVLKWFQAERSRQKRSDTFYLRAWYGILGKPLLRGLARLAGANRYGERDRILRNLVRRLRQRHPAVLLIDEAQHLLYDRADAFEQLRDVIDLSGCGCVLAGHFNFVRALSNGLGRDLEQWLSRIDLHEHLRGLEADEIDQLAGQYLGQELPQDVRKMLIHFASARDRNAHQRSALFPSSERRMPFRYLSIRRVRKFFERVEELHEIKENRGKPLGAVARVALKLLMAPAGRAL